ncbi:hypothetical protein Poli38472_012411 [Pythium oligandrum]|uniref:Protein kinase domain-containing protein n=1 Tax=Pythium oligandrum TaxID=41045 RepID=A0A8K1CRA6_PYTOL|nr:hypothetical protein Poli38472_012411 [Pythium oligandrum]|eukprot:TMW67295.1 hypothetical protein Poli38472_012411 [Pythium oligandrum]
MRLLLALALSVAPSAVQAAGAAGDACTVIMRTNVSSSEAYDGCYRSSSFSFINDGTDADVTRFCETDDCFDLYKQLRKVNGVSCLAFKGVEKLQLTDITKAEECFGSRVLELDSGSGSESESSSKSKSDSKSDSKSGSSGRDNSSSGSVPVPGPGPTPAPGTPSSKGSKSSDSSSSTGDNSTDDNNSGSSPTPTPPPTSTDSGTDTGTLIGIIGGSVGAVAVIGALLFVCCKRKQMRREQHTGVPLTPVDGGGAAQYTGMRTPTGGYTKAGTTASMGSRTANGMATYSTNMSAGSTASTLWDDEAINAVRIPFEKVEFGQLISRGGYGEVYRGQYRGDVVAIKTLLPVRRKDMRQIENFLIEVKLMATLEHERIVRFVGVAWDSLNELCVVTEFLDRGDLRSVLAEFQRTGSHELGFGADKVKIALHVAHALTYMHSLQPAVLHRDLKSRNILLDNELNAKLTDFGVSRERADSTMTAGVGSSLWMAPEVMMGERYDEKADVFSFGVVLSELDSHELPYAHAVEAGTGRKLPDTAILQLVSLGRLQVAFAHAGDSPMSQLGLDCVAVDPKARPTAAEVLYRVHKIWSSHQQL